MQRSTLEKKSVTVYFLNQEIVLWRKAPEKMRKRQNFHQRYESPESRPSLSAEQPEM